MLASRRNCGHSLRGELSRKEENPFGWWFGTFFIFPYIGNNNPNWPFIFFREVETTNQPWKSNYCMCNPWKTLKLAGKFVGNKRNHGNYWLLQSSATVSLNPPSDLVNSRISCNGDIDKSAKRLFNDGTIDELSWNIMKQSFWGICLTCLDKKMEMDLTISARLLIYCQCCDQNVSKIANASGNQTWQ